MNRARRRSGLFAALPVASIALLMLWDALPQALTFVAPHMPPLAFAAVYFWSYFRPASLPPLALFLAGLVQDALHGLPLGVSALLFIAMREGLTLLRRRGVRQNFAVAFGTFAVVAFCYLLAVSAALAWAQGYHTDRLSFAMVWAGALVAYPLLHLVLTWLYMMMPASPKSS